MTDQAPELLPCRAKRDDLGYHCGECGASWIGRQDPPDCLRNQIAKTILKKFLGVDDFKKTTEGWDTGCIELANEILALTARPSDAAAAAWRWRYKDSKGDWDYSGSYPKFASFNEDSMDCEPLYSGICGKTTREALDNSNSLFAAMLHEKRPDEEIEKQIYENRRALALPPDEPARVTPSTVGGETRGDYILPCDVALPPIETPLGIERDTILKGCTLSALLRSLEKYEKYPLSPTIASEKE